MNLVAVPAAVIPLVTAFTGIYFWVSTSDQPTTCDNWKPANLTVQSIALPSDTLYLLVAIGNEYKTTTIGGKPEIASFRFVGVEPTADIHIVIKFKERAPIQIKTSVCSVDKLGKLNDRVVWFDGGIPLQFIWHASRPTPPV
jgi:hypothetical protein